MKKHWILILSIFGLFIIDRLTKIIFLNGINNIDFGFFAFTFVKNTGASFGILKEMNLALIGVAVFAFGLLLYYRKEVPKISFLMLMGGILGNLVDRIVYGYVIDFINFKFFPIFNVADSLISLGVIYWLYLEIFKKDKVKIKS